MDQFLTKIVLLVVTGALIKSGQAEPLEVHLKANHNKVCEGDSVTIHCFYQPSGTYKVTWYYSPTFDLVCDSMTHKITEDPRFNTSNINNNSMNNSNLTVKINSIMTNDSGWYFCKVTRDKPVLQENCSNGIELVVEQKDNVTTLPNTTENTTTNKSPTNCSATTIIPTPHSPPSTGPESSDQWWIWLALAIGCTVLVVSIIAIFIITRKTEEIIYENTKPDEPGCWTWKQKKDICDLPASKKMETIKPLRKYDTYSGNRTRRT